MINVSRKLFSKVIVLAVLVANTVTAPVYAADISELIAEGQDIYQQQPESYKTVVGTYVSRVPNYIIRLFQQNGGSIHYADSTLVGQKDVNGVYIFSSKQIFLKVTSVNNSQDEVQKAPVHELGHFIYHIAKPMFTEEMNADIKKLYDERKSFDARCYNEDEAFASLYSDYIKYSYREGLYPMPSPEYRVFIEAERLCEQILE